MENAAVVVGRDALAEIERERFTEMGVSPPPLKRRGRPKKNDPTSHSNFTVSDKPWKRWAAAQPVDTMTPENQEKMRATWRKMARRKRKFAEGQASGEGVFLRGLHRGQVEIFTSPARFKIARCGRRWGKSYDGVAEAIHVALEGGRAWWVGPSYPIASVGWRLIRQVGRLVPDGVIREAEKSLTFASGGVLQVKSAENPDSLRGEGLDFAVLDEAAYMSEAAWVEAIRPALSDRRGKALFISTPNGRNWFWRLWMAAEGPEWGRWHFPTSENPHIDPAEIERARASMPERTFRQEYLAEFVEEGGGVFRRVREAAVAGWQDAAIMGHRYLFGVDWGKYADFTIVAVLDATLNQIVHLDRFNQIDYALQRLRLGALWQRFRPDAIIAERNSMGDPVIEQLQRDGMPVQAFTTTAASKTQGMDGLALAFERGELGIVPDPVLIGELEAYEMERLPSGMLRYGAPPGTHDDCVMAVMLAWSGVKDARPMEFVVLNA